MAQSCTDSIDPKKPILQIIQCLKSMEEKNSELQAKLTEVLSKPGIPGPEGKQGPQGAPGVDGIDGKDGANGESADFPKGAVVAFDLRDGCPVGWETFADAMGRVLIGSDPPDWTGGRNLDLHKQPLKERKFRSAGGEEAHTLQIEEMPSHQHTMINGGTNDAVDGPTRGDSWGVRLTNSSEETASTGGNQPHNNMQPFLALLYCKKI